MKKIIIPVWVCVLFFLGILGYLFRIIFLGIFLALWHFKFPKKYFFLPYKDLYTDAGSTWYNYEVAASLGDMFKITLEHMNEDQNPNLKRKKFRSPDFMFSYEEE